MEPEDNNTDSLDIGHSDPVSFGAPIKFVSVDDMDASTGFDWNDVDVNSDEQNFQDVQETEEKTPEQQGKIETVASSLFDVSDNIVEDSVKTAIVTSTVSAGALVTDASSLFVSSENIVDVSSNAALVSRTVSADASILFGGSAVQATESVPVINSLAARGSSLESVKVITPTVMKDASSLFGPADSLFGNAPPTEFDTFPTAPSIQPYAPLPMQNHAPRSGRGISDLNAVDVFNSAAPVITPIIVDPSAPPSAPGVRPPLPPSVHAPKESSTVSNSAKQVHKLSAPIQHAPPAPGMVMTPHGYVQVSQKVSTPSVIPPVPVGVQALQPELKINAPVSITVPISRAAPLAAPAAVFEEVNISNEQQPLQPVGWTSNTQAVPPTPYGMPTPYGFALPSVPGTTSAQMPSWVSVNGQPQPAPPTNTSSNSLAARANMNSRMNRPTSSFATFGFGGRLCVFSSDGTSSKRHLKTYKVLDTIQNTFADFTAASYKYGPVQASEVNTFLKFVKSFPNIHSVDSAVYDSVETSLIAFVDDLTLSPTSNNVASEKMLLMLLKQLISTKGIVTSEQGTSDPSSPETKIVKVVLGDFSFETGLDIQHMRSTMSQQAYDAHSTGLSAVSEGSINGDTLARIEALLLCGYREDAADIAMANMEWGLAILIGGICSPDKYKEIVRKYSDSKFPSNSTLNTLTKIFSNQPSLSYSDGSFQATWKRNVAAIVSNKSSNWSNHLLAIGDKLRDEVGDFMSAHFVYLCAGILPSAPKAGSKFSLIGSNFLKDKLKSFFSIENLFALRLTEIIEYVAVVGSSRRKESPQVNSGTASSMPSGIVRSLSGLFGLGGAAQPIPQVQDGRVSQDSVAPACSHNKIQDIPSEALFQFRRDLAPLKLGFAMLLADLGCIKDSFEYCKEIKNFIASSEESAAAANRSSKSKSEKVSSLFNSKFVRRVDEFFDRISRQDGCVVSGAGVGSIWSISNVLTNAMSASNLSSFVDGRSSTENTGYLKQTTTYGNVSQQLIPPLAQQHHVGLPPTAPALQQQHHQQPPPQQQQQQSDVLKSEKVSRSTSELGSSQAADSNSGIVKNLRKGIIGWLYPDAHDASENLGTENKAYFDKTTGRWVFPGEESKVEEPAMGPPPTISMSGMGISGAMPSSSSPANDDPLAALMAPPPRPGFGGVPSMSSDPLAALMAPPPRSVGFAPTPMPMNGGAPGAPPPSFQMWVPSTSANVQQFVPPTTTFEPSVVQASTDATDSNLSSAGYAPAMHPEQQPMTVSEPLAASTYDKMNFNDTAI